MRQRKGGGPYESRLSLRIEIFQANGFRSGNLVFRKEFAWRQRKNVQSARNFRTDQDPIVPIHRPASPHDQAFRVHGAAIMVGNLHGMVRIRPVEHGNAALIPGLDHDVASGNGNQRAVMRYAVFLGRLRFGDLVITAEPHLVVFQRKNGVGAPFHGIGGAAFRGYAAAPFVRKKNARAVVAERSRMPVGEVRIRDGVDALRIRRVRDVQQQPVAFARAARQANLRIQGNVMALRRTGLRPLWLVERHADPFRNDFPEILAQIDAVGGGRRAVALPGRYDLRKQHGDEPARQHLRLAHDIDYEVATRPRRFDGGDIGGRRTMLLRRHQALEEARRTHDGRLFGPGKGHLDHLDPEQGRIRVFGGRRAGATGEFFRRAHRGGTRYVNVHMLVVLRVLEHRMRVGTAAGLHIGDVFGIANIADVENANSPQAIRAYRLLYAFRAAIEPPAQPFARNEKQVFVHRNVALGRRTEVIDDQVGIGGIGNIPYLNAVIIPLDGVLAGKRQIGVRNPDEIFRRGRRRKQLQIPYGLFGVEQARLEPDAGCGGPVRTGSMARGHDGGLAACGKPAGQARAKHKQPDTAGGGPGKGKVKKRFGFHSSFSG